MHKWRARKMSQRPIGVRRVFPMRAGSMASARKSECEHKPNTAALVFAGQARTKKRLCTVGSGVSYKLHYVYLWAGFPLVAPTKSRGQPWAEKKKKLVGLSGTAGWCPQVPTDRPCGLCACSRFFIIRFRLRRWSILFFFRRTRIARRDSALSFHFAEEKTKK